MSRRAPGGGRPTPRPVAAWLLVWGACLAAPVAGSAQPQARVELRPGDTVPATPAQRYAAGSLHRFLLGDGHRELWALPVPAEVLDLDAWAGGLVLDGVGGGLQTRSLRFAGADGRSYAFRSIDKDATRTLEPELRETVAARILQDQISSLFPLSALVVSPLLEAAGVLHAPPRLVVMPRDPRLGEHLEDFGGLLGWIEERPDEADGGRAGFAGSSRIVGSDRLLEILEDEPRHRVSASSYLRARLVDVLVGDWDRHPGQWRWARFGTPGGFLYEPIPRDRDWALANIDGAFTWLSRFPWPHYVGFAPELGSAFRHTWSGRALDRSILPRLTWEEWDAIAAELQRRLSDDVIRDAVARLPESYRNAVGGELERALRTRRDQLREFTRAFHALVVGWAEVHGTDRAEVVRVRRLTGDSLLVEMWEVDDLGPAVVPYYRRVFEADVTREVRVHLRGGDDVVSIEGERSGPIRVRIVGGGGDDSFVDATEGERVHLYDDRGENRYTLGARTTVDESEWEDPVDPSTNTHQAGSRDWGSRTLPAADLSYGPDWGLVVGAGAQWTRYGFRRWPWDARVEGTVGTASLTGRLHGGISAVLPLGRRAHLSAAVMSRGSEIRRWYGTGNETEDRGRDDHYEAQRREVAAEGWLSLPLGPARVALGGRFRRLTDLGNQGTLIDSVRPYGYPDFRQFGLGARLSIEGEDPHPATRTRTGLEVGGLWMPSALDVLEPFGVLWVRGSASIELAGDARVPPVLALRVGARHVVGDAPYHERSFLGGGEDLRGHRNQRFSGDDAAYLNTEMRFGLGRVFLLLPFDVGAFALADVGRVWIEGEPSGTWHVGAGGGVWASLLDSYSASLAVVHGEITAVYLGVGFGF